MPDNKLWFSQQPVAFQHGWLAYTDGRPVSANPYFIGVARQHWVDGWYAAQVEDQSS